MNKTFLAAGAAGWLVLQTELMLWGALRAPSADGTHPISLLGSVLYFSVLDSMFFLGTCALVLLPFAVWPNRLRRAPAGLRIPFALALFLGVTSLLALLLGFRDVRGLFQTLAFLLVPALCSVVMVGAERRLPRTAASPPAAPAPITPPTPMAAVASVGTGAGGSPQ